MSIEAIDRAIAICGTQNAFAVDIGVRSASISGWRGRGKVPAERCASIEQLIDRHLARAVGEGRMTAAQALESRVTRYQLRPDVFGEAPDADLREAG